MLWDNPHFDLFAICLNHQLRTYVSLVPDPRAFHLDALSIDWTCFFAFVFVPWVLLDKVIWKIEITDWWNQNDDTIWPSWLWFPRFLSLLMEDPLPLPFCRDLLWQPRSDLLYNSLHSLNLNFSKSASSAVACDWDHLPPFLRLDKFVQWRSMVTDFLHHLRQDNKFRHGMIKGYHSCSSTWQIDH